MGSMRGSRNFRQGGIQVSLTKKALTTFFSFFSSPQLILQKSNGQFQEIYHFSRYQRGSSNFISRGGGGGGGRCPLFSRGVHFFPGGSNCLFPIETHITCDFSGGGGSGPPVPPPLDPHLGS